jgi:hypothetical protein
VDSVYTDFSKAFDRVRHQLVLEDLFDRENSKDKNR